MQFADSPNSFNTSKSRAKIMEEISSSNNCNINCDTSCCSKTNWTVADGSLVNSITFESSLSPTINDDDSDSNPTVKYPLILHPPSPDPPPCEITITFSQKHEVHQVYVRSTARVYEIYYASDLGSSNEYLCTVRCGIAMREEEVLCTPSSEEALTGASKDSDEKKRKGDSSLNTDEDGWVEVKALDSPQLVNGNRPPPSNFNAKQGESLQDLYEATAAINDAEPCMSITLRMLSLQNKGCIFVDEIYVFGEPVEPLDSDNRQIENQSGNSLMAMFMPTLLQLSRTRSAGQMLVDHSVDTEEKQKSQVIGSKATDSINIANKIQQGGDSGSADKQEEKLLETVKATAIPAHMEMPAQVSDTVCKTDPSSSHIEKVLDQLVLRVSRVEDIFLRFEERMLKPINSIDARLQRVEQKLEELDKKFHNSGLRCTRISAPEFSWHESYDHFDNSASNVVESDVKDYTVSIPANGVANSSNDDQSHSSLLVTDPVYSNADDEEENNALEAAAASANNKPKHAMSVDDALASALAGFLSSVSAEPHKYTQALSIKAPDFSVEEGGSSSSSSTSGKKASPEVEGKRAADIPNNAADVNECTNVSMSTSSNIPCIESEVEVTKPVDDRHSEKADEGIDDLCQHNVDGKDDSQDRGTHHMVAPSRPEVATEDVIHIENGGTMNNTSVDECETENQFLDYLSDDGSGSTQEEVVKERSGRDVLQDLKISLASSLVDFEIPVLDVKFFSQENFDTKSPFEALLDDLPETNAEALCAKEDDGPKIFQQQDLISVDDTELTSLASGNRFSMDMNYCSLDEMPLYAEGEKLHNNYTTNKEAFAESLI